MESLHKLLMFRKVLKIFSLIVGMWIVSLLTIVREYKSGDLMSKHTDMYEQALSKLQQEYGTNSPSAFRGNVVIKSLIMSHI